jgi:hypothetical protein
MSNFEANHGAVVIGFAKPLYGLKPYQGFESLPLRQTCNKYAPFGHLTSAGLATFANPKATLDTFSTPGR